MSAEELGRRLRGETVGAGFDEVSSERGCDCQGVCVEFCGAQRLIHFQVLRALKSLSDAQEQSIFNLSPLDRLVNAREERHQTRVQAAISQTATAHASHESETAKPPLFRYPVVEISSEEPGAGKTHLIYLIVAIAVLPFRHGSLYLNGKASAVIVMDTDTRFDIQRLVEIMKQYVLAEARKARSEQPEGETSEEVDENMVDSIVQSALQHIHIFQQHSFASLLSTLRNLPDYLYGSTHVSSNRTVHSIVLDSATSFYWQFRNEADRANIAALDPNTYGVQASLDANYERLVHELRKLSQHFCCAIVATVTVFTAPKPTAPQVMQGREPAPPERHRRNFLPHPWPAFPTFKLRVERKLVPKFTPAISIQEALLQSKARQAVVEQCRFVATASGGEGGFEFAIRNDGLHVFEHGVDGVP